MAGSSRVALVAMLVAVELVIVSLGVASVTFGHAFGRRQAVAFAAKPILPVAVGSAPDITINDPNSRVDVTVSHDGLVHVQDDTSTGGWPWWSSGSVPQLQTVRTANGVEITRSAYSLSAVGFVFNQQEVAVQVPSGAFVSIPHCQGAHLDGVAGGVDVHSQDGAVELSSVGGRSIVATSDDGHVSGSNLEPTGSLPRVTLHSSDGHVHADGLFPANGTYELTSDDGGIDIELVRGSDVTIDASTDDGSVRVDRARYDGGGLRVGSGSGSMRLHTADGSVRITTNGVL
jgi:hypothetical protein